jgi:dephospho-CoA kinase
MIIGLCGTSLAGRSELAKLLIDKGFSYYSIQNEIADDMGEKKALADPSAKLTWDAKACERSGKDVWVKRILSHLHSEHAVIDGIRHEEEVAALKKQGGFVLIGVYAPAEVRMTRSVAQDLMERRAAGKADPEMEDRLAEFRVLKLIDYSIPYPAKDFQGQVEEILKKAGKLK